MDKPCFCEGHEHLDDSWFIGYCNLCSCRGERDPRAEKE